VLVLSQGKSFLPCDCQVLLSTSSHVPQSPKDSCKTGRGDKLLEKWRIYLAFLRYFDLGPTDPGIKKHLEDDFVESRQKDPSITPESFHLWLTISRLLAISYGEPKITLQHWSKMRSLEEARLSRLPKKQVVQLP